MDTTTHRCVRSMRHLMHTKRARHPHRTRHGLLPLSDGVNRLDLMSKKKERLSCKERTFDRLPGHSLYWQHLCACFDLVLYFLYPCVVCYIRFIRIKSRASRGVAHFRKGDWPTPRDSARHEGRAGQQKKPPLTRGRFVVKERSTHFAEQWSHNGQRCHLAVEYCLALLYHNKRLDGACFQKKNPHTGGMVWGFSVMRACY